MYKAERNERSEEKVRRELKQIDELLDVKWYPSIGRYALVARWPIGDPKWELFHNGEMDDFHDILGWFSVDIHDADSAPVDVDSIEQKVLELLGRADNRRVGWKEKLRYICEKNIEVRRKRKAALSEQAEQVARDLYYMAGHNEDVVMQRIMKDVANESTKERA